MKAEGLTPDEVTYSTLIDFSEKYGQGKQLYQEMKRQGISANTIVFSNLIALSPDYRTAYSYFREMVRAKLKVDAQACFTLMLKIDDFEVNRSIVNQSRKYLNVKPDVFLYTRLVSLAPNARGAAVVYQEMLDVGVKPNKYTEYALQKHGLGSR